MGSRKLDDEQAFQFYVSLGHDRTHGQVAQRYGVTSRAIRKAAVRNDWNRRLERIELEAQAMMDKRLVESRADTQERHLRMLRAIATRGLMALQKHELSNAMDGVRAIETAVKLERLILGELSDRVGVSVEELTRREVETFLAHAGDPEDASPTSGEADGAASSPSESPTADTDGSSPPDAPHGADA